MNKIKRQTHTHTITTLRSPPPNPREKPVSSPTDRHNHTNRITLKEKWPYYILNLVA